KVPEPRASARSPRGIALTCEPGGPRPRPNHVLTGEKATVCAAAQREGRGGAHRCSPSPHRGEGRGEGGRAVVIAENSRIFAILSQRSTDRCKKKVTFFRSLVRLGQRRLGSIEASA